MNVRPWHVFKILCGVGTHKHCGAFLAYLDRIDGHLYATVRLLPHEDFGDSDNETYPHEDDEDSDIFECHSKLPRQRGPKQFIEYEHGKHRYIAELLSSQLRFQEPVISGCKKHNVQIDWQRLEFEATNRSPYAKTETTHFS